MPRLRDQILDCVVYLYKTKAAAEEGGDTGGSGFLLRVEGITVPNIHFNFVVTNRHVLADEARWIRLNTKDGGTDVLFATTDRIFESEKHDLALILLPTIPEAYSVNAIPRQCLVSRDFMIEHDIGIGDPVVMLGRFINREGLQRNSPSARFGHIAQMQGDPITVTIRGVDHVQEDAILIEVRSIGGYSGSPVFVLPEPLYGRNGAGLPRDRAVLLGVDFCHLTGRRNASDERGDLHNHIFIAEHTGMAGVIPGWLIESLVNRKDVQRALIEREQGN